MTYFELEDTYFRMPGKDRGRMEVWDPFKGVWMRYRGDPTRVVTFGSRLPGEPSLPRRRG